MSNPNLSIVLLCHLEVEDFPFQIIKRKLLIKLLILTGHLEKELRRQMDQE
jgi:hypothetical protein